MSSRAATASFESANQTQEWLVMVVYDDPYARERAMHLVHLLEKRFSTDIIFECSWWRSRYLEDPDIAMVARHYACAADIIIFSTTAPGLFPLPILNWIESWAATRRKSQGLLVPLMGSSNIPPQLFSTRQFYLHHVAERTHMDFLPSSMILNDPCHGPPGIEWPNPEPG